MMPSPARRRLLRALLTVPSAALLRPGMAGANASPASPYTSPGPRAVTLIDARWHDADRDRDLPVRQRVPDGPPGMPLLLFSHGLGGSRGGGALWAQHWASHGFVVISVQHPGSDESLWQGKVDPGAGIAGLRDRLRAGMTVAAFVDRVNDIHFVIDEARRQRAPGQPLAGFDGERIGMSGHSFGAATTLAVCGERFPANPSVADTRIRAGLAFSPSAGPPGRQDQRLDPISIPMLLVTGTRDGDVMGTGATPENRRATFAALRPPDKYLLVLDGAEHMNFNGGERQNQGPRGQHYTSAVDAISLAYWNATLRGDPAARSWLASDTGTVLAAGDVFSAK